MDKKASLQAKKEGNEDEVQLEEVSEVTGGKLYKTVYAILPIFPIILLLASYGLQLATGTSITVSVEVATIVSLILAILCELIRNKGDKKVLGDTETFFKGMGGACPL